jgi:GntR family transcriptional regulator of vanillate catabolism
LSGSKALMRQIQRAAMLPFSSPSALIAARCRLFDTHRTLVVAQDQHQRIFEAIERHEGAHAESLMREHSRLATRALARLANHPEALDLVPGSALIRRDGRL